MDLVHKDMDAPFDFGHLLLPRSGRLYPFHRPQRKALFCIGRRLRLSTPRPENRRRAHPLLQVGGPRLVVAIAMAFLIWGGCLAKDADGSQSKSPGSGGATQKQVGTASWYGPGFQGKETASGERFEQDAMTAASKHLPLGSKAAVTNLNNGKKAVVKINDRGPYVDGRVIDLSRGAAEKLGMVESGTAKVRVVAKKPSNGSDQDAANGSGSSSDDDSSSQ